MKMEAKEGFIKLEDLSIGKVAFECQICGNIQALPNYISGHSFPIQFPICNECKKDLKEIIIAKRIAAK
jgi:hypothetical protein